MATGSFLFLTLASARPAAAHTEDLVRRVHDGPDTVMVLEVEKISRSRMAEKERWDDKPMKAFGSGMFMVPPKASRFVLASQLDLDGMQLFWEVESRAGIRNRRGQ